MSLRPIRVLIVDDSSLVRKLVADALKQDPEIEVVGAAADPYAARDKIKELKPDVLTLDLEMPRMDGLTFLGILMKQHPLPVIIMSSLTQRGSHYALEALRLGAFDVLPKPRGSYSFGDLGPQLIARIKATAGARVRPVRIEEAGSQAPAVGALQGVNGESGRSSARIRNPREIILLGASTGGTQALCEVLTCLRPDSPPIAVVQHIPPVFSTAFAERLDRLCAIEVREAVDGDRLVPGVALIAPGDFHVLLQWRKDHYAVRLSDGPAVWHQRPAVDLLFKSAAEAGAAPHAVAGVLTGMGRDGADGLLRLRTRGATTFAQDEATSVVYGMPRAAWQNGAAQRQLPLEHMADFINRHYEISTAAPRSPLAAASA